MKKTICLVLVILVSSGSFSNRSLNEAKACDPVSLTTAVITVAPAVVAFIVKWFPELLRKKPKPSSDAEAEADHSPDGDVSMDDVIDDIPESIKKEGEKVGIPYLCQS